jgi:hypothetical protein
MYLCVCLKFAASLKPAYGSSCRHHHDVSVYICLTGLSGLDNSELCMPAVLGT